MGEKVDRLDYKPEKGFRHMLKNIERDLFIVSFSLFDEVMEILSKKIQPEELLQVAKEVGLSEKLKVLISLE